MVEMTKKALLLEKLVLYLDEIVVRFQKFNVTNQSGLRYNCQHD